MFWQIVNIEKYTLRLSTYVHHTSHLEKITLTITHIHYLNFLLPFWNIYIVYKIILFLQTEKQFFVDKRVKKSV